MELSIYLRAFKTEDASFINELRKDAIMENMIGGPKRFISLEREQKWVNDIMMNDNQSIVYLAVCEIGNDQIIGYTSLSEIDYRNGSCHWSGIKISPSFSGRGYGLQTILLAVKYAFEELRMERCIGMALEYNQASLRLMDKAGFQREGLMRNHVFKNGAHQSTWLLSLLSREYIAVKAKYSL